MITAGLDTVLVPIRHEISLNRVVLPRCSQFEDLKEQVAAVGKRAFIYSNSILSSNSLGKQALTLCHLCLSHLSIGLVQCTVHGSALRNIPQTAGPDCSSSDVDGIPQANHITILRNAEINSELLGTIQSADCQI